MEYISVNEAAKKWGVTERLVQIMCSSNRVPGARKIGRQWMIPISAEHPTDLRKEKALTVSKEKYHFPLLIYSVYYNSRNELSNYEQNLLDAQLMTLEGRFVESIKVLRKLLHNSKSPSVRFGAYFTLCFNLILLGMKAEIEECFLEMEKIKKEDSLHNEDYLLMIAYLKYTVYIDTVAIKKIDVDKLSPDAMDVYPMLLLHTEFFSPSDDASNIILLSKAYLRTMLFSSIEPIVVNVNTHLASFSLRQGDFESKKKYIADTCNLALKNGWYSLLAKCYCIDLTGFNEWMKENRSLEECNIVQKIFEENMFNWKVMHSEVSNDKEYKLFSNKEIELLLLVHYGMSNLKMQTVLGLSSNKLNELINVIYQKTGAKNKKELQKYTKKLFKIVD